MFDKQSHRIPHIASGFHQNNVNNNVENANINHNSSVSTSLSHQDQSNQSQDSNTNDTNNWIDKLQGEIKTASSNRSTLKTWEQWEVDQIMKDYESFSDDWIKISHNLAIETYRRERVKEPRRSTAAVRRYIKRVLKNGNSADPKTHNVCKTSEHKRKRKAKQSSRTRKSQTYNRWTDEEINALNVIHKANASSIRGDFTPYLEKLKDLHNKGYCRKNNVGYQRTCQQIKYGLTLLPDENDTIDIDDDDTDNDDDGYENTNDQDTSDQYDDEVSDTYSEPPTKKRRTR